MSIKLFLASMVVALLVQSVCLCHSYVICIDSDVDVGWRRWNVRGVYFEESW